MSTPELDPNDLFPHLERLLQPPVQRWTDGARRNRPALQGSFAGRPATLRLLPVVVSYRDSGRSMLSVELTGDTYGVVCLVTPPAQLSRSGAALGDPEFDAHHDVVGAPRAVLSQIFNPDVRARMKLHPCSLRFTADHLELLLGSSPRTFDSIAAQLALAATLLDQLPNSIRAAGEARYLELGSFATHPEVAAQASQASNIRFTVFLILGLFAGLTVLGVIAGILVAWWAFAG